MATIRERLESAAGEYARLCQTLAETEYPVSAHQQSQNYVRTLKQQIEIEEKKLGDVNHRIALEYHDHQKYRDSHMRRLLFKLRGKKEKFEEQATKEEKEWLKIVALQLKAKKSLEALNLNLLDATRTRAEMAAIVEFHNQADVRLNTLYNSIFQGPTPGMPEEDAKENEVGGSTKDIQRRSACSQHRTASTCYSGKCG